MISSSGKLLFIVFWGFIHCTLICKALAENLSLDFPCFSLRNVTLLGDSYLRNGSIGLTRELGVPSSSAGSFIFNSPVVFLDPITNASASFSTRFTFSVKNVNPNSYGDGLAFFLSPNNETLGSSGGYLGLVNSSNPNNNRFIAVEFDTRSDSQFNDISSNHVGLDVNNLTSIVAADVGSLGIDLKSGNLTTAWINYDNEQKNFTVWVSYSGIKPGSPIISTKIDLSDQFDQFMYVGFSAATEGSTELHVIEEWSFETSGFLSVNPPGSSLPAISDSSLPTIPALPILNSDRNPHKKLSLALTITCSVIFCIMFVIFAWISLNKWKEFKADKLLTPDIIKSPREISYRELKIATKGFHPSRIIGRGAFGTVYRGTFVGSDVTIAVKRSKHTQNRTEFLAELSIIASLRHKNLVQLQGWCTDKDELLLVYEFMSNGSLDDVLYREDGSQNTLKWDQRYKIAVGIASVLSYLHEECEKQVIHRDIKTSNILLDSNFNPRLGDFGLARLMDHDQSPVSTLTAGTMGYLAPEYLQCGTATEKTDTFSYGVVVLEIACGRRPLEKESDGHESLNLVDWVWSLYSEDKLIDAVDRRLGGDFDHDEMRRILLVGLSCANPNCQMRPSMRKVLQILNGEADLSVVPRRKPFLTFSCSLPLSIDDIVSDSEDNSSMSSF